MGTQRDDMIMFSMNQTGGILGSIHLQYQTGETTVTTDCQSSLKLNDHCIRVQRLQIQLVLVRGIMSGE